MNFEIYSWSSLDLANKNSLLSRPVANNKDLSTQVAALINRVQNQGDKALIELSKQFDGLSSESIVCDMKSVEDIAASVHTELKAAIDEAYTRIERFHSQAKPKNFTIETAPGVECTTRYQGYESIGLYIPGGSAPLISTVLMTGAPANIAGVKNIRVGATRTKNLWSG